MTQKLLYIVFALTLLVSPLFAFAQQKGLDCDSKTGVCTYSALEPIPGLEGYQQGANTAGLKNSVDQIFKILFTIGALIAVARLVAGGIMYMTSEIVDKKSDAKKWMQSSIYGILILAGSWLILYTINPKLLEFKFNVPSSTVNKGPDFNETFASTPTPTSQNQPQKTCEYAKTYFSYNRDGTPTCQ